MSPKKLIAFIVAGLIVLGLVIAAVVYSGKSDNNKGPKGPAELTVWVVGDDTDGFKPLVDDFQKSHPNYKNTKIVFTKFASYQDYERSLINVIADGNSPDIFVVPSTGAGLLESKIQPVSDSYFEGQDLSSNLNRLFDPLLEITPGKNSDGKEIQLMTLKGAPLGYETIGAFYNRSVLDSSVPATWEEFEPAFLDNSTNPPVALGMGSKYVTQAASVASVFFVQNGIESIARMGEGPGVKGLEDYFKYYSPTDSATLMSLKSDMDQKTLSMTDMFAQGKVSVIFGYPSLLREIEYSIKRAGDSATLEKRDLRSAPIPQKQSGKKSNLARYSYFAVSKFSQNLTSAEEFVGYLTTKPAGDLYSEAFPQYLPARNDVLETLRADKRVMNKTFPWVQYDSFVPSQDVTLVNFDRGLTSEFEQAFGQALDRPDRDASAIIQSVQKQVECRKKQLLDRTGFEVSCEN